MRLSALFGLLAVFALAAVICVFGARVAVSSVETRSVMSVRVALEENGYGFASVLGDGLQVILEGQAPSEAARFRAISTAGSMVDASRVIDNMTVVASEALQAPEFSIEILRNDSGISAIGLIPTSSDRESLAARLSGIADDANFADFLETADYEEPLGWDPALNYALRALRQLPRSKISVRAGFVSVEAISDSPQQKAQLESSLRAASPDGMLVTLNIMAPRPVVSPFLTRFSVDENGARFENCVVDSIASQRRLVAAAETLGVTGSIGCPVALGSPTAEWGDAVIASMNAITELGAGTVTISDADVTLVAVEGTVQGNFDRIVDALEDELPEVFALDAVLPEAPDPNTEGPAQFVATLSPEGLVQLRGRVSDELMSMTIENFARAKFGAADISMRTQSGGELPSGWAVRVLAGLEALSKLSNGSVTVEPDFVTVRGNTGIVDASTEITQLLTEKVGEGQEFSVEVTYVEELDPIASLPTEEECLAQIIAVTGSRKITFEPSSANIAGAGAAILDDIAEILQRCPDTRIEIAGYTDSQGSEGGNQRLSQQRANAVLDGLRVRRVPVSNFRAVGYGEENPIADNGTEEGREANRRIEFTLIVPESTEEPTALEQMEQEAAEAGEQDQAQEGANE